MDPLDQLITQAKADLDQARRDGDATVIATAINRLNARLDRKLSQRETATT